MISFSKTKWDIRDVMIEGLYAAESETRIDRTC
jgi:hypothetical protein